MGFKAGGAGKPESARKEPGEGEGEGNAEKGEAWLVVGAGRREAVATLVDLGETTGGRELAAMEEEMEEGPSTSTAGPGGKVVKEL
ncbi:UNVERIFIED_CONTAM: hypothetical protein FKN15_048625 [Acipenser sinensis]